MFLTVNNSISEILNITIVSPCHVLDHGKLWGVL